MSCYLCAYSRPETPYRVDPTSTVLTDPVVGTCHKCHVHACPAHGTRYNEFLCGICYPARALKIGLGAPPDQLEAPVDADDLDDHLPQFAATAQLVAQGFDLMRMDRAVEYIRAELRRWNDPLVFVPPELPVEDEMMRAADTARGPQWFGFAAYANEREMVRRYAQRQSRLVNRQLNTPDFADLGPADSTLIVHGLSHLAVALGIEVFEVEQWDPDVTEPGAFPNPWAVPGAQALPALAWLLALAYLNGWGLGTDPASQLDRPLPPSPAGLQPIFSL